MSWSTLQRTPVKLITFFFTVLYVMTTRRSFEFLYIFVFENHEVVWRNDLGFSDLYLYIFWFGFQLQLGGLLVSSQVISQFVEVVLLKYEWFVPNRFSTLRNPQLTPSLIKLLEMNLEKNVRDLKCTISDITPHIMTCKQICKLKDWGNLAYDWHAVFIATRCHQME